MSSVTSSPFPPELRIVLEQWFEKYGSNAIMEIEMRVQEVGGGGFDRLLNALQSSRAWSSAAPPYCSLDVVHATKIRETHDQTPGVAQRPPSYMRKQKGEDIKVPTASGFDVRFQVSSETETSADSSPAELFRHKQRYTFVHKNMFKFELTRVKQGPTREASLRADTTYEVEIEFCGQENADAQRRGPAYLADSLLMKAADVLQHLASGQDPSGAAGGARRARAANGPLQECDELDLVDGTEVLIEPSGHSVPVRFNGEMPGALCGWLYSHAEPDGRVCVMSEAATIHGMSYPLFYFVGTVPKGSVSHRR